MEHVHIAALRPNLDALESKQIKAVVTLIWPYSSSQRQFALLLAEPDFRLRRNKGQVRARFSSTSARALAATGVGIGDEVVLSLHGAHFLQDGAVSTPGKSIDWELAYTQTVAISVRRNGAEIANLELIDAAPTPAPRSPVKKPAAAPSPIPQWSSPAFLKRARLSDGPFFEQPAYDPLADGGSESHDRKRRRKSYRDWKAWTYTARTPSPEKEDAGLEEEWEEALSSPSRPTQLPKTPISPSRTEPTSAVAETPEDSEYVEETTVADSAAGDTTVDDGELQKVHAPLSTSPERPKGRVARDSNHYHLHAGPHEAPLDSQYDFGGDTELNTEDEDEDVDEDVTVPDIEVVDASTTEVATDLEYEPREVDGKPEGVAVPSVVEAAAIVEADTASATEEDSDLEVVEADQQEGVSMDGEDTTIDETAPQVVEPAVIVDESVAIAMPPPSLPNLHTDFVLPIATDLLTPIGKEPSSPNLKAVDSATLPLPSPFPGEQATSYFEHGSVGQQQAPLDGPPVQEEPEVESDVDYIMENSFFSSISSSKAGVLHQDHETVFTPVRFTFGADGAGWSRPPLDLSSPTPEEAQADTADAPTASPHPEVVETKAHDESIIPEQSHSDGEVTGYSSIEALDEDAASTLKTLSETAKPQLDAAQPPAEAATPKAIDVDTLPISSNAIVLSSDVESVQSEEEDVVMVEPDEEQTSQEQNESESEDDIEAESGEEHETESEAEDTQAQQPLPVGTQVHTDDDTTIEVEPEAEEQQPRPQADVPVPTQASAGVYEVVDLGSPSVDESSDDEDVSEVVGPNPTETDDEAGDVKSPKQVGGRGDSQSNSYDSRVGSKEEPIVATRPDNFDDFFARDAVQEATIVSSSPNRPIRGTASIAVPDTYEEPPSLGSDDWEPQLGMDEPLPLTEDRDSPDAQVETIAAQVDTEHPDVKMESVEDGSLYLTNQSETQDVPQESSTDPATEVLIAVPEKGSKLGELQFKSVPATAPARNTRSKAKSAVSPPGEDAYVSTLSSSTRRTRSKASFDSVNRDTTSPTHARVPPGSTVSPEQGGTQTSPYSLRSQSKHQSPDKHVATSQSTSVRKSTRKLVRRDTDFDIVPSQAENRDLFGGMFEPSQELGFGYSQLSQGRYSDVGFVKDSEEDTLHSETSISTVQSSDPGELVGDLQPATPRLKPPPASLSQTQHETRSRSRSIGQQSTAVSLSQPPQSPRRSPRLTRSTFSASPSPRVTRTTRGPAQVSPVLEAADEHQEDEATPTTKERPVIDPPMSISGEGNLGSSSPAPSIAIASRRSSSAAAPASAQQPPFHEDNVLTPENTQQTAMEPPLSFQARQPDQSLPITPKLTQTTSASATLRSFDIPMPGVQTQPAPPSPALRTSPRRKPTAADPKSSSPTRQSSDAISAADEDTTLVTKPELPSIGLSTPLAYYTPLRDLIYFLNRSSQFHSSSNPDILALCTSASTPPGKAKKGPRHWSTTLHVTDPSVWPQVRNVNVFRAYQNALPVCDMGDVVLLRAFAVESRNRQPLLRSQDESSWCVWRYGKPVWGAKKGRYAELRAREEVKGPVVERGEGEWAEVEKLRAWYLGGVRGELEGEKSEEGESKGRGAEGVEERAADE